MTDNAPTPRPAKTTPPQRHNPSARSCRSRREVAEHSARASECPQPCDCPTPPGGPPASCLDDAHPRSDTASSRRPIGRRHCVEELTAIQGEGGERAGGLHAGTATRI